MTTEQGTTGGAYGYTVTPAESTGARTSDSSVRDYSATVRDNSAEWDMLDAVFGGTKTMRAAGKTFLPSWPGENDPEYQKRLGQAVLFPMFKRTCEILASKPFSRPITLAGIPTETSAGLENIDNAGQGIHAFFFNVLENCLSHGVSGVLADFPPVAAARTLADQKAVGAHSYLVHYPAGSVLGFTPPPPGETNPTMLRLLERAVIPDGAFGEKIVEQVRVLYEGGAWEVWRESEAKKNEWYIFEYGTSSRRDIPFTFFYGNRTGFGTGESPLKDLAYLNVEHWQSSSDQQTILHVARVPILFMKGFADTESFMIGAATAATATNKDADMKYVEPQGAAIGHGRTSILDLEERGRAIGAELLVRKTNRMTATQVESEDTAGDCMLQAIVEMFELGVKNCLRNLAIWNGEDASLIDAEVFSEFSESSLSDAIANVVFTAVAARDLSKQTGFEIFKRSGYIDAELTWEQEKARQDSQPADVPPPPVVP